MADFDNNPPSSSDALERTLSEILAAEPILDGRNGQQFQTTAEELVKDLLKDKQLHHKLLNETRLVLGLGLGKFISCKIWTELEKSDKKKSATKGKALQLTLRLPDQQFGAVRQAWPKIAQAFLQRTGLAISEPVLATSDDSWILELRGGVLGCRALGEDWFEPLLDFFCEHARSLLTLTFIKSAIEASKSESPAIAEEMERLRIPLATVHWVLGELLDESISIAEMEVILSAIVLAFEAGIDRVGILSQVRNALSPWICSKNQVRPGLIRAVKIGKIMEKMFLESLRYLGSEQMFALEPAQRNMVASLLKQAFTQLQHVGPLVVLTNSRLRKELYSIVRSELPGISVLSESEIHRGQRVEIIAIVDFRETPKTETVADDQVEGVPLF